MLHVSRKGVTELAVVTPYDRYELPCYVFSCLELKMVYLENCRFKPPLEFQGFPYLEDLDLRDIDFGARLAGTKINLPQLKNLSLVSCTNVYNFKIKATKLQNLQVCGCPDATLLHLLDSPCLFKADIAFGEPIEDFARDEKMNLTTMLSNLPGLQYFYIDSHFLKLLNAEKIPKSLPREISSLKHLRLHSIQLGDLDQLHGALRLLRSSPNLAKLTIIQSKMEPPADVGPASNHLESPNCLDCTLNHLQTVEMWCLKGSKPELLFIEILLAHSPSLKKFTITPATITPDRVSDLRKQLDIAMDVMQFPRASPKAKVVFSDSW